jgi:preprotein translocase subunit SecY
MVRTSNKGIYQKEFGTDHGLSSGLALIMAAEISAELPD